MVDAAGFLQLRGVAGAGRLLPRGNLLSSGLNGSFNGLFIVPTYTPATTVLGAQPNFSLAFAPAYTSTSARVGLGPLSASRSDSLFGGSDLYPTAQLFWNFGVHNVMAYLAGDIPVGSYDPNRLSNIGIGHGAIDGGGAYTYLNTKTGTEVSATLGFTGNFENPSTNYTNGIDSHLDFGAAQFLNEQFFVGVVGYYYQQLTRRSRTTRDPRSKQVANARRRPADRLQFHRGRCVDLHQPARLHGVRLISAGSRATRFTPR